MHLQTNNLMTLHTSDNCTRDPSTPELGTVAYANCAASADGWANQGCGVTDPSAASYGAGVNAAGGAVWATLIEKDKISIWRWFRADVPADVAAGAPVPGSWGTPTAAWGNGRCDLASKFKQLQIVVDLTICGDWAGNAGVWAGSSCSSKWSTCAAAVPDPANFKNAEFTFNSIKAYSI